jgi:hypothetical protein
MFLIFKKKTTNLKGVIILSQTSAVTTCVLQKLSFNVSKAAFWVQKLENFFFAPLNANAPTGATSRNYQRYSQLLP